MPINVIATEGILNAETEKQVFSAITDSFLKHHQGLGNTFLTPIVIGEVSTIPKGKSFAGGKPNDIVIVELKMPTFAFETPESKQSFTAEVTEIIHQATGGKQPKERIFVNMVFTIDGMWGIGGRAYTNAELGAAFAAAAG
jgi:phenylpyruvate tautomerase PptA (4-oxalocrotonate tautomerase family)